MKGNFHVRFLEEGSMGKYLSPLNSYSFPLNIPVPMAIRDKPKYKKPVQT